MFFGNKQDSARNSTRKTAANLTPDELATARDSKRRDYSATTTGRTHPHKTMTQPSENQVSVIQPLDRTETLGRSNISSRALTNEDSININGHELTVKTPKIMANGNIASNNKIRT